MLPLPYFAAGQGLEPRFPGPEPGVLPLDDPAVFIFNCTYFLFGPEPGDLLSSKRAKWTSECLYISERTMTESFSNH